MNYKVHVSAIHFSHAPLLILLPHWHLFHVSPYTPCHPLFLPRRIPWSAPSPRKGPNESWELSGSGSVWKVSQPSHSFFPRGESQALVEDSSLFPQQATCTGNLGKPRQCSEPKAERDNQNNYSLNVTGTLPCKHNLHKTNLNISFMYNCS